MKPRETVDPRLRDLAYEVLNPHSQSFLAQSGLCEGMTVLEIGCGAGSMTSWLSRQVGRSGRVVALDSNPRQVERARLCVKEQGLDNAELVATSVDNFASLGRSFDFIYGRFILMQLQTPLEVLQRLVSCLAPHGVIALDEPNQEADLAVPPCPPCECANRVLLDYADHLGLNFRIGDALYSMLSRLGLQIRVARACQPILPMRLALQMFRHGLMDSVSPLLEAGVISASSLDAILDELEGWPASEDHFYALSRQVQVSAAMAR